MTPAILALKRAGISFTIHEYTHDPAAASYGLEAAESLGVPPARVFKTLVASVDGKLVVGLVPVERSLDLKALAAAVGGKRGAMANVKEAERATGYVTGGISPLGQRRALPMVVDTSALEWERIFVSAGRRGMQIEVEPNDMVGLLRAKVAEIASDRV